MDAGKAKRIRRDPDMTRKLILDATEQIMVEESYAAVSSRRVAQALGLTAATIHYYYPTTDDLFVALHQRMMDRHLAELETILDADRPLEALWKFQSHWDQSALGVEFIMVSSHRKQLGEVISRVTNEARKAQAGVLERALAKSRIGPDILSPVALATISIAIARTLANEERIGITQGHDEVRRFVDWAIGQLQPPRAPD